MKLTGQFQISQWDETPNYESQDGHKMSLAAIKLSYTGDLTGEAVVNYSMCYLNPTLAYFSGFERLILTVGDRQGVILLTLDGQFAEGRAQSDFKVVANAGEDDFAGVTGQGYFSAGTDGIAEYAIELDMP